MGLSGHFRPQTKKAKKIKIKQQKKESQRHRSKFQKKTSTFKRQSQEKRCQIKKQIIWLRIAD